VFGAAYAGASVGVGGDGVADARRALVERVGVEVRVCSRLCAGMGFLICKF
jgi:hypothetical protein